MTTRDLMWRLWADVFTHDFVADSELDYYNGEILCGLCLQEIQPGEPYIGIYLKTYRNTELISSDVPAAAHAYHLVVDHETL